MGLDSVELIMEAEEAFKIEISNHEAEKMCTVGELYDLVISKLGDNCNKPEVWKKICEIIVHIIGVSPEKITPDARFVDDLGMS